MALQSMTGFAREHGFDEHCSWTWEVKSVNGKGRDVRCRVPQGLEELEIPVRDRVAKQFQRGNFNVQLSLTWTGALGGYRINRDMLEQVIALVPELQAKVPDATPPSIDGLLNLRGVIEPADATVPEDKREALDAALLAGLDGALQKLAEMRAEEGARLKTVLEAQLDDIDRLRAAAEALAATQPDALRQRLADQISALLGDARTLDAGRLEQEAALLMTKADIREELDRLAVHVAAARGHLAAGDGVGRKLDFLCQEFNRESNTLCSKSWDKDLTAIGLDLKAVVDQVREQVQNIE